MPFLMQADDMNFLLKVYLGVFVLGLIYFPVASWEAAYDRMCKGADADLKAFLEKRFDPYLPDKRWALESVCGMRTLSDLIAKRPGAQEVFRWQRTNPKQAQDICDYKAEIVYCYEDRPMWLTVVSVIQGVVVLVWLLLVIVFVSFLVSDKFWREFPSDTILLIVFFGSGLASGWYLAQWLYA